MKKYLLIVSCFLCASSVAQNLHVSGKFGLGSYKGELKPKGGLSQSSIGWSIGARYDITEHFVGRLYYNRTKLKATSTLSGNLLNLNFESKLNEVELGAQYQIFSLNEKWWTPYVFLGGAVFSAKPFTMYNGAKVFLQPLGTEGQGYVPGRKTYKTTNLTLVYGLGAEYALGEDIRVGIEASYRRTGTDYIDDVSLSFVAANDILVNRGPTALALAYRGGGAYPGAGKVRGSNITNDKYYFLQLTVTFRPFVNQWKRTSSIAGMKKDKRVGCPQTKGIF